jgi:hypothetical protein
VGALRGSIVIVLVATASCERAPSTDPRAPSLPPADPARVVAPVRPVRSAPVDFLRFEGNRSAFFQAPSPTALFAIEPAPAAATTEVSIATPPPAIVAAPPGACPTGMVFVEGEACTEVEHVCLQKMEDDPARRCLEFKVGADKCIGSRGRLRFCMDRYEWPGTPGAQPRVLVDYFAAEKLCKSVGKRMCKEDEFYLACEGPEHWPYAWGHVRHPSPCNVDRPYFMVDWKKWAKGGEAMREEAVRLDQALPIGTSKCWSPYGIHDIAGNVDEWTTSRPGRELLGSLNGGYWGPVQNACRYVTLVHGPEFMFYQIGFRCCADAH